MFVRRAAIALLLSLPWLTTPLRAFAAPPEVDPEKLKTASEEFDAGRRAYKLGEFEEAAIHFENAFRDAPRPEALRMAIKTHMEAGNLARAATWCVRAQTLYSDDADTIRLTQKVLAEVEPKLHRLNVRCDPSCSLVLDDKLVTDQPVTSQTLYTTAGPHKLVVGWPRERSEQRSFEGAVGTSAELKLKAPLDPAPDIRIEVHDKPAPPVTNQGSRPMVQSTRGLPPVVFVVSAGVTAVVGGVAIWSGLDTRANPGPDAVRRACVGLGPDCPEYQDGIAKERRTNYLLVGTALAGVTTGVIAILTDWRGDQRTTVGQGRRLVPIVGMSDGLSVGAAGRF